VRAHEVGRHERLRQKMRTEILDAASLMLKKGGPEAILLREIARQVGVTPPAIYRYFRGRDELMSVLREMLMGELCDAIESARDQSAGHESGDRMAAMARAFRGWALDYPAGFGFVLGLRTRRNLGGASMARLLALFLEEGARADRVRPASPGSMLDWAALYGLIALELSCDPEELPESVGLLYEAVLQASHPRQS
jgi:AcrR family transcriptional regulator